MPVSNKHSEELRKMYKWLRTPHKPSDEIPTDFKWKMVSLLADLDRRVKAVEILSGS